MVFLKLPNKAPNDCLHLQGRLQGRGLSKNQDAGPVKCKALFASVPSDLGPSYVPG